MTQKRSVLYARTSGDDRGNEGRNLAGQLDMAREYSVSHGYQVVAELAEDDKGASGAEIDLPQLNRVRDMARGGEFDVLIVREIDRLSRNLAKQLIVDDELRRCGVAIEYVLGEYPDSPEGNFMKHVRASVAEFEREKIRERMTRGRRLKVKAGCVLVANRPPYGYSVQAGANQRNTFAIDEPEAHIVSLIFSLYTEGDESGGTLSTYDIVRKLTAMGVPTPADSKPQKSAYLQKRGRGQWNPGAVYRILRNETYTGVWHYGKYNTRARKNNPPEHWIAVSVPPLVSQATWKATQERIETNRHNGKRKAKYDYLLRARVTCGECQSAMPSRHVQSRGHKSYLYYVCGASDAIHYSHRCDAKAFRAEGVDAVVWAWIKEHLGNPDLLYQSLANVQAEVETSTAPIRERIGVMDDLLSEHRRQQGRLLDLYLSGEFDRDMLADRKSRYESTIAALEKERANLVSSLDTKRISDERIQKILTFANNQQTKVELATRSFAARRMMIEELDVKVSLVRESGEAIIYASCVLGEERLRAETVTMSGLRRLILYDRRV